jgi:hypothetical protein
MKWRGGTANGCSLGPSKRKTAEYLHLPATDAAKL